MVCSESNRVSIRFAKATGSRATLISGRLLDVIFRGLSVGTIGLVMFGSAGVFG
jgi:hypothetical protein